ncbi:TPA: hypothetical protein N0F65_004747 [Lagenidium giganteum]|uniref:PA14 domain-containing protein n=1 Tax=Lagenidium giganteum TaxID=4803 RepID=A0AAV2YV15_9STRA|nr:TPA: hypothetical protein N0F65_004747 [Lagenidium giganteum]
MIPHFAGVTDQVCGFYDPNAAPVALPEDGTLWFGNSGYRWGFQVSHHGPCEVWCDDKLVMHDNDCLGTFGSAYPAKLQIDVNQCRGAKQMQFLWLAVHFAKWQYWHFPSALITSTLSVSCLYVSKSAR